MKRLQFALWLVLVGSVAAPRAVQAQSAAEYPDVPRGNWAYDGMRKLIQAGILDHSLFDTYSGPLTVTRLEFARDIARIPSEQLLYPDVPRKHWAFEAVDRISSAGLVEGHPDGLFRGDQPLTRYEFPVAIIRMIGGHYIEGSRPQFRWKSLDELEKDRLFSVTRSTDVPRGHYAYEAVQLVQRLGIMQGNSQQQFLGDKPLTRYEYAMAARRFWTLLRAMRVPQ